MVLFLHITTRIPGRANDGMLQEKGGRGFPYLVYLDAEGNVLGQPGGRTVAAFQKTADLLKKHDTLKARLETGGMPVKVEFFFVRAALGKVTLDEAKTEIPTLTLSAEQQAQADVLLVDLEVGDLIKKAQSRQVTREELGARCHALLKAGKSPGDDGVRRMFYSLALDEAEKVGDVATFEVAFKVIEQYVVESKNPRAEEFLAQKRAALEKMKAGGTPAPGGAEGGK